MEKKRRISLDALAHRTGLPTANMLWRSGSLRGEEIVARLRWLEPVAAPGERFLYNHNMYLVAGQIVARLGGRKWNDFLRSELLAPLGMKSTVVDSSELRGLDNVAAPHATDAGKLQRIERHCPDAIAPAGAIHSNVLDMAQWLRIRKLPGCTFKNRLGRHPGMKTLTILATFAGFECRRPKLVSAVATQDLCHVSATILHHLVDGCATFFALRAGVGAAFDEKLNDLRAVRRVPVRVVQGSVSDIVSDIHAVRMLTR